MDLVPSLQRFADANRDEEALALRDMPTTLINTKRSRATPVYASSPGKTTMDWVHHLCEMRRSTERTRRIQAALDHLCQEADRAVQMIDEHCRQVVAGICYKPLDWRL